MSRARSDLKVTASDALEFEAVGGEPPKPRRGLKVGLWGLVLVVIAAGGWFVYGERLLELASGEVGDIPLIRAAAAPVKVRPENPGGLQVPNRDKLVYGRLQSGGEGTADRSIERLLPKPESPLPKPIQPATPADAALARPTESAAAPPKPTARVPALKDVASVEPPPPPPPPSGASLSLSKGRAPLQLKKSAVRAPAPPPAVPAKKVVSAPPPAPTAAARPAAKPAKPKPATAIATAGTGYRVQLAAARTPERAQAEWDRMRRKNLDLLGDLGLTVTKADLGPKKGVFYRLRVGPLANESQARTLCKELSKRKMGCLVVKPGR